MHIVATRIGGHRKSVWHWQTKHAHHLCQVGTLAAQQVFKTHRRFAVLVIKSVDVRHLAILEGRNFSVWVAYFDSPFDQGQRHHARHCGVLPNYFAVHHYFVADFYS